jgi:tRNA-dihydrouridine synthase
MGNEADKMAEAAALVAEAGADVVDLNLGCPMPRVVRKGVGAAMLRDPVLLERVLGAMRRAAPGLLSVKMRAGYDDADRVVETARLCERAGVDFLAVHPRRRADFYEGVADWRIIAVLARELRIPVIGNGDVWYAADAQRMQAETGCAAVMIGRPALRNPFIFEQIAALEEGRDPPAPTGADVIDHLRALREALDEGFPGARHGSLGKMKEVVRWIGRAVRDDGAFAREALRASTVALLFDACDRHLAGRPASELDLDARGECRLEASGSALGPVSCPQPLPRAACGRTGC